MITFIAFITIILFVFMIGDIVVDMLVRDGLNRKFVIYWIVFGSMFWIGLITHWIAE